MVPGAVLLAFGGALGMGAGANIQRHMVRKDRRLFTESEVMLGQMAMALAINIAVVVPLWGFLGGSALVPNPIVFWGAVGLHFVANIVIQVSDLFARRYADVSLTLPYQAMTPGLLTVAVLFAGEMPGRWGYVGIALIALGVYIHGRLGAGSVWAYLIPLWRLLFLPANVGLLTAEARQKARDEQKGVRLAFLSAFCGTFGLLAEGMGARHGNPALMAVSSLTLLTSFSVFWFFVMRRMSAPNAGIDQGMPPLRERIRLHGKWLVARGACLSMAGFCPMIANRLAPIAYIGTLKRLAIPIGAFIAKRYFHEKVPLGRWVTISMITTGAVILVLDGTPARVVDLLDQLVAGK